MASVTETLLALAANGGDVKRTAQQQHIDEAELKTLRRENADQYKRLKDDYERELEDQIVARARANASAAADLEEKLLEKVRVRVPQMDGREAAQAAKAVADVKSKNIEKVLSMTGRDIAERPMGGDDVLKLVLGGVASGVFRLPEGMTPEQFQLPPGNGRHAEP